MNDYWYLLTSSYPIVTATAEQVQQLTEDGYYDEQMVFRTKNEAIDGMIKLLEVRRDE